VQPELILRARQGDHEAFTQLVGDALNRLHRTARLILRSDDLAADAVQEALLSAWLNIRAVREPERFDGWLYKLVVHACYRQARRTKRRTLTEIQLSPLGFDEVDDASVPVADRDQLERAFSQLPPDHRAVLVVRHYLGMSEAQAASILDIPIGTYKSRLSRATQAIRRSIEMEEQTAVLKESLT